MNALEAQQLTDSINTKYHLEKQKILDDWIAKYGAEKLREIDNLIKTAAMRGEYGIRLEYRDFGGDIKTYQVEYLFSHYKNLGYKVQYDTSSMTGSCYLRIEWGH